MISRGIYSIDQELSDAILGFFFFFFLSQRLPELKRFDYVKSVTLMG